MKKAFTLTELIVVMAMIAILSASMMSAVGRARTRSKIAKATQETRELTNAILAYEQYAPDRSLSGKKTDWANCTEDKLSMVLGRENGANGERIPVLLDASIVAGAFRDPWGRPYELKIQNSDTLQGGGVDEDRGVGFITAPYLPNYNRLTDKERGL